MRGLIAYFIPKTIASFFENLKANAFILFNFILLFLLFLLFMQALIFTGDDVKLTFFVVPFVSLFAIANLYILKYKGIKLAGNILSLGLVLAISGTLNTFSQEVSILIKYTSGFYLSLGILVVSVLFATQRVLLVNFFLILISTTRGLWFGLEQLPEEKDMLFSGYISHIIALVTATSIIYFTIRFTNKSIDKATLEAEINEEQNKVLKKMVAGIKTSAAQIEQASQQLSDISLLISQNANEQAATTEEISVSMEEVLATINSNTEKAKITSDISNNSANKIQNSNTILLQTVDSVSEISEKISIISEIAGKTDMLSINAAIEAARAGEVGKGFSVVASEIRKLADNTRIASEEINELSESGKKVSKQAGDTLNEIIPEIVKSSKFIEEIVSASIEQQEGVSSINTSVQELTKITSDNSASSEEMSASAEELAAQAEQLNSLINSFNRK